MNVLAPHTKKNTDSKSLTKDEKNMRWALNKFFYNKNKNTLKTAYTLLLKEKYCDEMEKLCADYPSFHQFRYFYRKIKKLENYYISRDGLKNYDKNTIKEFKVKIAEMINYLKEIIRTDYSILSEVDENEARRYLLDFYDLIGN